MKPQIHVIGTIYSYIYSYWSPLSIHTKISTNILSMTTHDVLIMVELKIVDFQWNIGQNSPGFWFLREGNDISDIHSKYQDHEINIFVQNGYFWFSQVATTPPRTRHLWQLTLPPPQGVNSIFSPQNDSKGCTLDYIDGLGHFLSGFGSTGKNSQGGRRSRFVLSNYQIKYYQTHFLYLFNRYLQ